jgi:hypothetical protein
LQLTERERERERERESRPGLEADEYYYESGSGSTALSVPCCWAGGLQRGRADSARN